MSIEQGGGFAIPSDPKSREAIAKVFKDMSHQLTKCEGIKDYVKDAKKAIKEEYEIPMSVINRLFNLYHKDNAQSYFDEQRDTETLYEVLFEVNDDE